MLKEEIKYVISGNENYYISQKNQIIGFDNVNPIPIIDNKVTIPLYGIIYVVYFDWLTLFSKYNIRLSKGYTNNINNLCFKPYSLESHKINYDHLVVFKEPVYYKDNSDYRLLAMYPDMAVNEKGDVVNVVTGKYNFSGQVKAYSTVTLYNAIENRYKTELRHRIIGLAWVENDDFVKKPIIDHVDGDKQHCHASNLEWVSFSENNKRAAIQGLRFDNMDVKVKDYKDNKVVIFRSMTQACEFMGRSRINRVESYCYSPKLINRRYQIKLMNDTSQWDFDKVNTINVVFGNKVNSYYTIKELMIDLFPGISVGQNRDYVIKKLESEHPGAEIYFPEEPNKVKNRIYQAFNYVTKEILAADSLRELGNKVNLNKGTVTKAFHLGEDTEVSGYAVREKSDKPWKEITKHVGKKNLAIVLKNLDDGTTCSFNSIRKVSNFLKVNRKRITTAIKNKRNVNNYLISKK